MDPRLSTLVAGIETQSVHRILAPIANQLSRLLLFHESRQVAVSEDKTTRVDEGAELASSELPALTDAIKLTLTELTTAALDGRDAKDPLSPIEAKDKDADVFRVSMATACRDLSISAEELTSAASMISLSMDLVRDEPTIARSPETAARLHDESARLVKAANAVLQQTIHVLLLADEQEAKNLVVRIDGVVDVFSVFLETRDIKDLVPRFRSLTESILEATAAVENRSQDLSKPRKRASVNAAIVALRKTPSALCAAMQTYVKYPDNVQARTSRDFAAGQFVDAVDEVKRLLVGKDAEDAPASFRLNIDEALESLRPQQRTELTEDFDTVVEAIIRHSMTVLHLTVDESHRSSIVSACQRVLKLKSSVADYVNNVAENPSFQQLRRDFDFLADKLADGFKDLESVVNEAVLKLLVTTFAETHEPLERLIKVAMVSDEAESSSADFEDYVDDFALHAESMAMVASFVAASSSDTRRVYLLQSSLRRLESLDPEVVPGVAALRARADDAAALEHLRLLKSEWRSTLESVAAVVDEMVDPRAFFEASLAAMKERISTLRGALLGRDATFALQESRALAAMGSHVAQVGRSVVNRCCDVTFRAGLSSLVTQMESAPPELRRATRRSISAWNDESNDDVVNRARDRNMNKAYRTLNCAQRVLKGMNAENHPDVFTAIRRATKKEKKGNNKPELDVQQFEDKVTRKENYLEDLEKENRYHEVTRILATASSKSVTSALSPISGATLVRHALSTSAARLDFLLDRLAARANHLTEVADDLIAHVTSPASRVSLDATTKELTDATPSLVSRAKRVHKGDINELAALNRAAADWDDLVTKLEARLEEELMFWEAPLANLKDAVDAGDERRVDSEGIKIQDISQSWSQVLGMTLTAIEARRGDDGAILFPARVNSSDDVLRRQLQQHAKDLPRLTQHLLSSADVKSQQDKDDFSDANTPFRRACREWSAGFYIACKRIDEAMWKGFPQTVLQDSLIGVDVGQTQKALAAIRDANENYVAMAEILQEVGQEKLDSEKLSKVLQLARESKLLSEAIADVAKAVANNKPATLDDGGDGGTRVSNFIHSGAELRRRLFSIAPLIQKVAILTRAWTAKVESLAIEIDGVVEETAASVDELLGMAYGLLGRSIGVSSTSFSSASRQWDSAADAFIERIIAAKRSARDQLQRLVDGAHHENAHDVASALEAFSDVSHRLHAFLTDLADHGSRKSPTDNPSSSAFQHALDGRGVAALLRREWACQAHALVHALQKSPGVSESVIGEVRLLILGQADKLRRYSSSSSSMDDNDDAVAKSSEPRQPPSPPASFCFATPSSSHASSSVRRRQTPRERRQLKSLKPLMMSTKFSDSPLLDVTSTPIRKKRETNIGGAVTSPPLEGTPIRKKEIKKLEGEATKVASTDDDEENANGEIAVSENPFPSLVDAIQQTDVVEHPSDKKTSTDVFTEPSPLDGESSSLDTTIKSSKKIADAAFSLQRETEKFGIEATKENAVMKAANSMSLRMSAIADYFRASPSAEDAFRTKEDLLKSTRAIASDGAVIVRFAKAIALLCADSDAGRDLLYYSNQISSLSTQLTILASVKASSSSSPSTVGLPRDTQQSDAVLVKNAQNMMEAVSRTLRAAEGACVKGLVHSPSSSPTHAATTVAKENEEDESMALAAVALSRLWRDHLDRYRRSEVSSSILGGLGLRRVDSSKAAPKLIELATI